MNALNTIDDERGMKLVFSQYLAGWLMTKGHMLRGMRPNKTNKYKNVFLFKWSDKLEEDIENFRESK